MTLDVEWIFTNKYLLDHSTYNSMQKSRGDILLEEPLKLYFSRVYLLHLAAPLVPNAYESLLF